MTTRFVLLGAAGYVAPKHFNAIKQVGGQLIAAMDPHDSVGVLDSYFTGCYYFNEFERFDRFCEKYRDSINYAVIATPNYLHDTHARWAMRKGFDVICEKPTCLTGHNLIDLIDLERKTGKKVNTILQLRLHPALQRLKAVVEDNSGIPPVHPGFKVDVEYHTPRGLWYDYSWKADFAKSGGLATNIGVHLIDVVLWLFDRFITDIGEVEISTYSCMPRLFAATLQLGSTFEASFSLSNQSDIAPSRRFVLSVNSKRHNGFATAESFADLHVESYREILAGRGFGLQTVMNTTSLLERLRRCEIFSIQP